jgi:hypothetical protein
MSEYQEEVLTNLLDLQAELRGDEPEPHDEKPVADPRHDSSDETVTIKEKGLAVSVAPTAIPVHERLQALNDRLSQLELDLAGVTKRIARMEPDEERDRPEAADTTDVDAPWRSFIDLQKIVADRLDHD